MKHHCPVSIKGSNLETIPDLSLVLLEAWLPITSDLIYKENGPSCEAWLEFGNG